MMPMEEDAATRIARRLAGPNMDEFYSAMRPHQRGMFNVVGAAAQGIKGLYDSGANAASVMHRILGNGAPVTMDEVAQGAGDASMFAIPGTMGRKIAPRDEYMATKFGNSDAFASSSVPLTRSPNHMPVAMNVRPYLVPAPVYSPQTANGNAIGVSPLDLYNIARHRQQTRADARQYYQDMGEIPAADAFDNSFLRPMK